MPFRYGIATMTRVPHLILQAALEVDGRVQHGCAADHLTPKWFTKNPDTPYESDVGDMLEVLRHACAAAESAGWAGSVFEWWQSVRALQGSWAAARRFPPLLWGFGVSLVERAVIDAFCRAQQTTFARAVREDAFGFRPDAIYPELAGRTAAELLPSRPLEHIIVRHTIGLLDPLTDDEIPEHERVCDGLPESLESCLREGGITHLKIKLAGDIERDRARLRRIAEVADSASAFTLDGNEHWKTLESFRELWESLRDDPLFSRFFERMIFVEQPLHRDAALTRETARALLEWRDRPAVIIDESDGETGTLATALAAGYAGGSHKNCKGVFKGLANACLVAHRIRRDPAARLHLSSEDLCNVGPLALPQDLAVAACLGILHSERNGHHYIAGLAQFPRAMQDAVLAAHGDLYAAHARGFPAVRIQRGRMAIRSIIDAPFGLTPTLDLAPITPADEWHFGSLGL